MRRRWKKPNPRHFFLTKWLEKLLLFHISGFWNLFFFRGSSPKQNHCRQTHLVFSNYFLAYFLQTELKFYVLPVSGWQVPCWWQLHGTHGDSGPLLGSCRVNPAEHCSQNWPAKPSGQEHNSTHGAAMDPAETEETEAEVRVTLASWDVSRK